VYSVGGHAAVDWSQSAASVHVPLLWSWCKVRHVLLKLPIWYSFT